MRALLASTHKVAGPASQPNSWHKCMTYSVSVAPRVVDFTSLSHELSRMYGFPLRAAMNNDVLMAKLQIGCDSDANVKTRCAAGRPGPGPAAGLPQSPPVAGGLSAGLNPRQWFISALRVRRDFASA